MNLNWLKVILIFFSSRSRLRRNNCGNGPEVSGEKWENVVFLFIYLFMIIILTTPL